MFAKYVEAFDGGIKAARWAVAPAKPATVVIRLSTHVTPAEVHNCLRWIDRQTFLALNDLPDELRTAIQRDLLYNCYAEPRKTVDAPTTDAKQLVNSAYNLAVNAYRLFEQAPTVQIVPLVGTSIDLTVVVAGRHF